MTQYYILVELSFICDATSGSTKACDVQILMERLKQKFERWRRKLLADREVCQQSSVKTLETITESDINGDFLTNGFCYY